MSKFITNELDTIDCGDDEWVKIPKELSVEDAEKVVRFAENDAPFEVFLLFVKEWNFKDVDGKIAEINLRNVKRLNLPTFSKVLAAINAKTALTKKKLQLSNGPFADTEAVKLTPTT